MKRGWLLVAIFLVEAACAFSFGFLIWLLSGFAQGSGSWHGPGRPTTAKELAASHAAGVTAFTLTFAVVLAAELASTAGVILLVRSARQRRASSGDYRTASPRPLGVWFIVAAFAYSACSALALAAWTHLLGGRSVNYLSVAVQLVAGVVGLWLTLTRQAVPVAAVVGCAAPLCVVAYFTTPPVGPSLVIWPIVLLLLLANDSARHHFMARESPRSENEAGS